MDFPAPITVAFSSHTRVLLSQDLLVKLKSGDKSREMRMHSEWAGSNLKRARDVHTHMAMRSREKASVGSKGEL